jgi:hypothetical protein
MFIGKEGFSEQLILDVKNIVKCPNMSSINGAPLIKEHLHPHSLLGPHPTYNVNYSCILSPMLYKRRKYGKVKTRG